MDEDEDRDEEEDDDDPPENVSERTIPPTYVGP